MGVFSTSAAWLNYWDGVPTDFWNAEQETNWLREKSLTKLNQMLQQTSVGGYVLRGAFGVGKRELVRTVFQLSKPSMVPTWVSGSAYGKELSYGAIHFLLTDLPDNRIDSPLVVYGFLKEHFAAFDGHPVIIIENCELIDALTIAVLCQLVSTGTIKIVVIDDLADVLPDDVSALIRSGLIEVLPLNELTLSEARDHISTILNLDVSYLTASKLWNYCAGSSEALRAVVLDCKEAGLFEVSGQSAALRNQSFPVGLQMEQYTARFLERLSFECRELLGQVASMGCLPMSSTETKMLKSIDSLCSAGLLRPVAGSWHMANPAIAQTLIHVQGNTNAGYEGAYVAENFRVASVSSQLSDFHVACQPVVGEHWHAIKQAAYDYSQEGKNDSAVQIIRSFFAREDTAFSGSRSETDADKCDAMLSLLELCLSASRIADAHDIISSLDPTNQTSLWPKLNVCQQYRVLAFVAEYEARTNDHEQAGALLDRLLSSLDLQDSQFPEYRFPLCMRSSLRSLINTAISLGKWEQGRSLIQLVMAGSLIDMKLVAYVETVHAVMLSLAGNYGEAQRIIGPLQHQLKQCGTKIERIFSDSVELYIAGRSGNSPASVLSDVSRTVLTNIPIFGLECLWQSLGLVAFYELENDEAQIEMLESLAEWAEQRGENLTASHLWAAGIRQGGFDAVPRLRRLQEGHDHELAVAFRLLCDGVEKRDSLTLAEAVAALAVFGFVGYATDDGAEIFRFMNPNHRRQSLRKVNSFLKTIQPDFVRSSTYSEMEHFTILTDRERFIASAAASGLSNLEISQQASISVRTVEGHLYQVYSKLGISKRGELCGLTSGTTTGGLIDVARWYE